MRSHSNRNFLIISVVLIIFFGLIVWGNNKVAEEMSNQLTISQQAQRTTENEDGIIVNAKKSRTPQPVQFDPQNNPYQPLVVEKPLPSPEIFQQEIKSTLQQDTYVPDSHILTQ